MDYYQTYKNILENKRNLAIKDGNIELADEIKEKIIACNVAQQKDIEILNTFKHVTNKGSQ